jgi:uncharacterized protein (TIGR03067 family)
VLAGEKKEDKEAAVKKEWKRLNGTWEWVSSVTGKEVPIPKGGETVTIKDGKYTVRDGGKVAEQGTAKIDPTTRPKSVDLTWSTGPNKGKTVLGVYEVEGDEYRVCFAAPRKPRPTKVSELRPGSGHRIYTFKRAKARD